MLGSKIFQQGYFMKPHFTWSRVSAGFTAAGLLLALNGCSFLYDLNTSQCNSTADCRALGAQFSGTVCSVQQHICVADTASTGGAGNIGGSGSGGANASAGMSSKAGNGSSGGSGDSGGGGGDGACSSNADCIAQALDQPAICREDPSGNQCIVLTTEQCPVLLPTTVMGSSTLELLKTNSPLILGGFASMALADPHNTLAVVNWDLAFEEFNEGAAKNSNKSKFQPVLGLICNGNVSKSSDLDNALSHLTEEVGTPAILSTLSAPNLLTAWNYTQSQDYTGDPVMFLSTSSATLQLANLDDDGYVWHLLGDPRLLAATVSGLVRQIEPFVVQQQPDTTVALKVALVSTSDNQTLNDMATVLTNAPPAGQASNDPHRFDYLSINGDLAIHQSDNFYQEQVKTNDTPSAQTAGEHILQNPPQIIIGLATKEFVALITEVESNWGTGPSAGLPRPYYVLSHYLATLNESLTAPLTSFGTSATVPPLDRRIVGVNYALAQDQHSKDLYNSYLTRLKRFYGKGDLTLDGTENFYDGAYSLLYASSLTNRAAPTGAHVRDALENRVFNLDASSVDIGPSPVETELPHLIDTPKAQISLWGTDGPPNFDRVSGTRLSATSAWCMADAGNYVYNYTPDGLLYDPASGTFSAPSSAPACLTKFQQ
ncbi:MAG TPA: hypothetical protein VFK05_10135 [Polyangiaceae bacterium]|nr:hypothetical protein [Polyangiaceae bacterium]